MRIFITPVYLYPDERIVIIEDTGEIQCVAPNCVIYHTSLEVTMTSCCGRLCACGPTESWSARCAGRRPLIC